MQLSFGRDSDEYKNNDELQAKQKPVPNGIFDFLHGEKGSSKFVNIWDAYFRQESMKEI